MSVFLRFHFYLCSHFCVCVYVHEVGAGEEGMNKCVYAMVHVHKLEGLPSGFCFHLYLVKVGSLVFAELYVLQASWPSFRSFLLSASHFAIGMLGYKYVPLHLAIYVGFTVSHLTPIIIFAIENVVIN